MRMSRINVFFLLLAALTFWVTPAIGRMFLPEEPADKILVQKSERKLYLLKNGEVLRSYHIGLGPNPVGHKTQEGDGKTPEGKYKINGRNPKSAYHLSLRVSYPNAEDKANAAKRGVSPGGDIMIHGLPNALSKLRAEKLLKKDWTAGCIAVSDKEIEEIWRMVPNGTEIEITP
ncbi:MAG: L,D-transpeptidase family protein [Alphaproteobacteria bacterium]|nr:L,D-transpeptidase family protein [Alphaproteobacteria bacterium]